MGTAPPAEYSDPSALYSIEVLLIHPCLIASRTVLEITQAYILMTMAASKSPDAHLSVKENMRICFASHPLMVHLSKKESTMGAYSALLAIWELGEKHLKDGRLKQLACAT